MTAEQIGGRSGGLIPMQTLGGWWRLTGTLKPDLGGLDTNLEMGDSLTLIRKVDVLSPHIRAAAASQHVVARISVTLPSGSTVTLFNARVTDVEDTHELEEIELTFQKIEIENKRGKGSFGDNWH